MSKFTLKDLEMPDDEPMVIIRSSLLWICNGDKYAAAALNMYVHWTRWLMKRKPIAQEINAMLAKKGEKPSQDTTYIIYRKQQYLIDDLLGFCSDRRLRQANDLLQAKGLLKIEDTPRYLTDHVLKYELQIGVFKELIDEWRKHREENNETTEDEEVEVALEADSTGTDNYPSRSGKKSVQSSVRSGKKSVPERIIVGANNIDDKNIEIIDDKPIEEKSTASASEAKTNVTSSSSNNFLSGLSPEARKVHEEWSKMPWFPSNGMGAPVNKTLAAQYEEASAYEPTTETMLKVREWATSEKVDKKGYYTDKAWCFKFFLNELPGWLSKQPVQASVSNQQDSTANNAALSFDDASQLADDAVAQAQDRGYQMESRIVNHGNNWAVAVTWLSGRQAKRTITSRAQWDEEFIGLSEMADMLRELQGAK